MKNFTIPITIFAICLFMSVHMFAQNAERTLVKSFNLNGNNSLILDLEGEVNVQHWNKELVRVQIHIKAEDITDSVLKALIIAGRYNLLERVGEDGFVISSPELHKEITIRGQRLKDHITYTVYAPETVIVQLADESATYLENTEDSTSAL